MLFLSLSLILLSSLALSFICNKLHIPSIIGYLAVGIALSPYAFNLIDPKILAISEELRKIALIIILIRAGLSLDLSDLKSIGRPALLMAFMPALFEIVAVGLIAPQIFAISYLDAFILGSVLGAVSPAVVVPRMVKMIDDKHGMLHGVPQMIIAGSSLDDVFVIVIFTALTTVATGGSVGAITYLNVPISIVLGVICGILLGFALVWFFKKFHIRDTVKVVIICAICFGLVTVEAVVSDFFGFSSLLATITLGIVISTKYKPLAVRLAQKYSKLWVIAEILLFVMVGASINLKYFSSYLGAGILVIVCGLAFRCVGVLISLIKTKFDSKERVFCALAYMPKATVQAAIGGIPLSLGLASGELILSVAVISILFTATLGAFIIDTTKNKLVSKASSVPCTEKTTAE